MPIRLSIVVCTYNPVPEVFERCIASIATSLDAISDAEVIVVDNNSQSPILDVPLPIEGRRHLYRCVREPKQGLTPARLRGILEAEGDLLVFVDDDNFVVGDFFSCGISIADKHPFIGAYSGQVRLLFEKPPPDWTTPYHGLLVRRLFESDRWSNLPNLDHTMPCGAGLFVRREVARHYAHLHESGARRVQLDRAGDSLLSAGDNDLAACACDIGLGVGLFHELILDHHIPPKRLEQGYLLRLAEGICASSIIFKAMRGETTLPYTFRRRMLDVARLAFMSPLQRRFYRAQLRGEKIGRLMIGI